MYAHSTPLSHKDPVYNILNSSCIATCMPPAPPLALFLPKAAKNYQQP